MPEDPSSENRPPPPRRPRRQPALVRTDRRAQYSRLRRGLGLLLLALIVASALLFRHWTDPQRVQLLARTYLENLVNAKVTIGEARFSLFGGVRLSDVRVTAPCRMAASGETGESTPAADPDSTPLFTCSDIVLKHRLGSALLGQLKVDRIIATRPTLSICRDLQTGRYNVSDLIRSPSVATSDPSLFLPAVRLRDARFVLSKRDGDRRAVVEDLTLSLLAEPTYPPGGYGLIWEGGGQRWSRGRSRLDLYTGAYTDIEGGLPWLSLEGVALAADGRYAGVQRWCDLLGLTGQFQIRDFELSPAAQATPPSRARITLDGASLSIPLDEVEKTLPLEERYLRLTDVTGKLDFDLTDAQLALSGRLHGSQCRLQVHLTYPKGESPTLAELGLDGRLEVDRLDLPRRNDPQAPAQQRFIERWHRTRSFYRDFDPHGQVNIQVEVAKAAGKDAPIQIRHLQLEGLGCDAAYRRFPYRVTGITGLVEYTTDGVHLRNIRGTHADGKITANGRIVKPRWFAGADLVITGRDIPIDDSLHDALSERYQRVWDHFTLDGRADIDVTMHREHGTEEQAHPWQTMVQASLKNVTAEFQGFRYPLEDLHGDLTIDGDQLLVRNLQGRNGPTTAGFNGQARFLEDGIASVELDVTAKDVGLDERLLAALSPQARAQVAQFQPLGSFDLAGRLWRSPPSLRLEYDLSAALTNVRMTYEEMPIPLADVSGTLRLTPDRIMIEELAGRHAESRISASGAVETTQHETQTDVTITCRDLLLEPGLIQCLPPSNREAIRSLDPRGPVDAVVRMRQSDQAGETQRSIEADIALRGVALCYGGFPLPVEDVRGQVRITPTQVSLTDLTGRHQAARFTLEGTVTHESGALDGHLSGRLEGMTFSEPLRQALPWRLRRAWNNIKPLGEFDLSAETITFQRPDAMTPLSWQFTSCATLHQAGVDAGVLLRRIDGQVRATGRAGGGSALDLSGTVEFSRANVNDYAITDLTGRLDQSSVDHTLQLSDLIGHVYGGRFKGRVSLDRSTASGEYSCHASIRDLHIDQFLNARRKPNTPRVTAAGMADGHLYLTGNLGDPVTAKGGGRIAISDGQLFNLPLMLAILAPLDPAVLAGDTRQSATADFILEGRSIALRDILIKNASLALIGDGTMQRNPIDLDLRLIAVSSLRELSLPILTELLEGAARELVELRVRGPLSAPTVTATPLRSVNDAIEAMLGSRASSKSR